MGKTQIEEVVVDKTTDTPVVDEKKEEVVDTPTPAKGKKIKIVLLMNVHDGDELFKEGSNLELTDEELKRFHSSFYKVV